MSSNGSAASDWLVGSKRKPVEILSSDESESESDTGCGSAQKRSRIREDSVGTIVSPITIDIGEECHDVAVGLSASSLKAKVSEFDPGANEVQRNPVSNTSVNIANNTNNTTMAPTSGNALASSFPVANSRTQSRFSSSKVVLVSRLSAIRSCTPNTAYLGRAKMHGFDFHVYPFTNMQDVTRRFGYSYTTIVNADHPDLCYIPTTGDADSHGCDVNSIYNVGGGSSSGLTDVDTASVASDTSASDTTSILTAAAESIFTVPVGTNTDTASKDSTSTNTNTSNTSITSASANYFTTTDSNLRDRTTTFSNTTSKTSTSTTSNTTSNTTPNTTSNTTSLSRQVVLVSPECGVKESSFDISTSSPGCLGRARAGKYVYFVFRYTNMRDINDRFGLGCTSIVSIDDPALCFIEGNKSMQSVNVNMYDNSGGNMVPNDSMVQKAKKVRFDLTSAFPAPSTTSATLLAPPEEVSDTSASASGSTTGSSTTNSVGSNSDSVGTDSTAVSTTPTTIPPTTTTTTTLINIHQVQQYFTELNAMDDNTLRSRHIDPRAFRVLVSAQVKLAEALNKMMSWK